MPSSNSSWDSRVFLIRSLRFLPPILSVFWLAAIGVQAEGATVDAGSRDLASIERPGAAPSTVILISLDGTRPVDVTAETLPSLLGLAKRGARAKGLIPATPSNTFPSHVTMVTGVSPDRHGIVNNFFLDPARGRFRKKDIPSWIEVEPLWSLLAGVGVVSASYHWVGSEGPWRTGRGPRHTRVFSASTPVARKVRRILAWLDLDDPSLRPRFITSWFPGADHVAHRDGPGSATARARLARHDPALQTLIEGIGARNLWSSTTLMVVSDHGMAPADRLLDFDLVLKKAGVPAWVTGMGGFAMVYLKRDPEMESSGEDASARTVARVISLARSVGLEAIRRGEGRGEGPGASRFSHPRFGDLVIRAPIGTAIHRPGLPGGGFHGYASSEVAMHGLFIAAGRGVSPGRTLPLLHAIDIAPTVLSLLGVEIPETMHGTPIALEEARPQK